MLSEIKKVNYIYNEETILKIGFNKIEIQH